MSNSQSSITQHTAQSQNDLAGIEQLYQNFCAGCHGFNGIAWYVNSPSFALRERLEKQDTELAYSIKNGLGEMPSWEYMLKPRQIDKLVEYIRTLSGRYESGIVNDLHPAPQQYFRFLRRESVKTLPASNLSSQY